MQYRRLSDEDGEEPLKRPLSIDEALEHVGGFGRFQQIFTLMCCCIMCPCSYQALIIIFAIDDPPWKCNSSNTTLQCFKPNKTFPSTDKSRCAMPRTEWEYVTSHDHSIVTQFDLVCEKEFLRDIAVSIQYFGFMFGAVVLSWMTDNFGRRKIHFFSLSCMFLLGVSNIFVPNIYLFIACRFVIGFFLHGTYPQLSLMLSEIVGQQKRALASNMIFIANGSAACLLALKAYFLSKYGWRTFFFACSAPYSVVLFFFFFIPESVRFLQQKGRTEIAVSIFERVARWNKKHFSKESFVITKPTQTDTATESPSDRKSTPLDLFASRKMGLTSVVFGFSSLTSSMTYYCMYLASSNISGHIYRDVMLISIVDVPISIATTPLLNKYGRKRGTMFYTLITSCACLALGFTPNSGGVTSLVRVLLGVTGKMCDVGATMSNILWTLELYPTSIRAEAIGLTQVLDKIGAASSAWIAKDLNEVYPGAAFLLIGGLGFLSFCLQGLLKDSTGMVGSDVDLTTDMTGNDLVCENSHVNVMRVRDE